MPLMCALLSGLYIGADNGERGVGGGGCVKLKNEKNMPLNKMVSVL